VSPRREIRSERGQQLQGLRAGFVSRAVASGTDVVLVLCVYVVGVVTVSIAWDLFFSTSISIAVPPHWLNELLVWILLVAYLTAGWWSSGRTLGKQMLGLRVVRSDGSHLRFWRTFLRALLCATFFPVLLMALVSRRNRGLEDVIVGTVVTYDWLPTSYEPLAVLSIDAQPMIEMHQSAEPIVRSLRGRLPAVGGDGTSDGQPASSF
jgi:uncharacterized RDD family membrane protein YckC